MRLLWIAAYVLAVGTPAQEAAGQNAGVDWSSFGMGFVSLGTNGVLMDGSVGQTFAGETRYGNTQALIGFMAGHKTAGPAVSVPEGPAVPAAFSLHQNFPNPFNPTTTIAYAVGGTGSCWVRLGVYDLLGREVAVLVNEKKDPGTFVATLHAGGLASGVYFYRIQAGSFVETKKLVVLR